MRATSTEDYFGNVTKADRSSKIEMSATELLEDRAEEEALDQLVQDMPDELKDAILESDETEKLKAQQREEAKKKKEERVEPILDTWVFSEEIEKRDIVPLTLERPPEQPLTSDAKEELKEKQASEPLPLPKYFAELYNEFEELRRFDLKEVIYDAQMQGLFLEEVRDLIEQQENMRPVKKQELWKAVKESKFPIIMGAMAIVEGTIDFSCAAWPTFWLASFRTAVFSEMAKEGMRRGTTNLREERIAR